MNEETDVVVNQSGSTYLSLSQDVYTSSNILLYLFLDGREAGLHRGKSNKRKRAAGNNIDVTAGRLLNFF